MFLQMMRLSVFVFLPITVCVVICFCVDAVVGAVANKNAAEQAVIDLKALTKQVMNKAQTKSRTADNLKTDVEWQRKKAERAESEAAVAEGITAEKSNTEFKSVAQRAKSELENCLTLYPDAKKKAEEASNRMKEFLSRARALNNKAEIEVPSYPVQQGAYAKIIASASTVGNQTETLNREIDNASSLLYTAENALSILKECAQKVQVAKYQAESIVCFSRIESMLNEAEIDIQSIKRKRDEINATVQEMTKIFKSYSGQSIGFINSFCGRAEIQLQAASRKVQEAQKCKNDMLERHPRVVNNLAAVRSEREDGKAKQQFETVQWHEKFFDGELQKIKKALKTAETSISSANSLHRQMLGAISPANSQSGSGPHKENQQDGLATEEVITSIQDGEAKKSTIKKTETPTVIKTEKPVTTDTDKSKINETENTTIIETDKPAKTSTDKSAKFDAEKPVIPKTQKPTLTDTEKPILGMSENSMDKTSDQLIDANVDNAKQNKSTPLIHEENQNPKDHNEELLNKDKFRNITKNMKKNPLIDGEVPKWSAANDSAVSVSIPLLVTLISSAVLN